ncbi:T9SS type A sorting domain-containing protein [Polaribacter sp. R77954]|uniref:T9SS type A sorting domain-containing protein n=1 Tax=Polaribacter sp. R77954 TaxID=3093870 RepID=UPI0037C8527A
MKNLYYKRILFVCLFFLTTLITSAQMDMMNAIPMDKVTHKAVKDGSWFTADTWDANSVPETGAIVYIPAERTVNYQGSSEAHIFAIRVDGNFNCTQTNANQTTKLVFDTFFAMQNSFVKIIANNPTDGKIEIEIKPFDVETYRNGTNIWNSDQENFYRDNNTVTQKTRTGVGDDRYNTIEEANNGDFRIEESVGTVLDDGIGVLGRYNWDPKQLSLGFVTMGQLEIIGQEKLNMVQLSADAFSGSNSIQLKDTPIGWTINDDLIITSGGNVSASNNGEDLVKIQTINGNTITTSSSLNKNHEGNLDDGLHCYVGNLTRNIVFKSPATAVVTQRGHVMAMHNDKNVQIKNAQFKQLGRTDKSRLLDDFIWDKWLEPKVFVSKISPLGQEIAEMKATPVNELTNSRGRYSIHLHKLGTAFGAKMAQVTGNVVWDYPGWGITHHDSHANVSKNVVYDGTGAGIVSETGSETGTWDNNLVVDVKQGHDTDPYVASLHHDDYLFSGQGLAMKGRAVLCRNNVIANARRGVGVINMNNSINNLDRLDAKALATSRVGYEVDNFPLSVNGYSKEGDGVIPSEASLIMENTIVIDSNIGLRSIERDMSVNHESRSIFDGFKVWGANTGFLINYQADYSFKDVYISGKNADASLGIDMWKHSHNQTYENIKLEDLKYGIQVSKVVLGTSPGPKTRNNGFTPWLFVDLETVNVDEFYELTIDESSENYAFNYTEHADNTIHLTSDDISTRPTTFTILDEAALSVDYNDTSENAFRFEIDGIITDDFGSYDMGIQQALAQGDLRFGYPKRIYQFASKAKFEEYLTENGVFKDEKDNDQLYFIINESLPNRRTFKYTTFPVRIKILNAPNSGVFANPLVETPTQLAPQYQLISRLATVSQSSTKNDITYNDGTHGDKTITLGPEKAIDGNVNGRENAQYYQRNLVPVGSFSHTKFTSEPYYDLDFGEQKVIDYYDIWNTIELNGTGIETVSNHFKNFSVFISDTPFTGTTFQESKDHADYEYTKDGTPTRKFSGNNLGAVGRYMRIHSSHPTNQKLKFAEIEVIGKSLQCDSSEANIIENGSAECLIADGSWTSSIAGSSDSEATFEDERNIVYEGNNAFKLTTTKTNSLATPSFGDVRFQNTTYDGNFNGKTIKIEVWAKSDDLAQVGIQLKVDKTAGGSDYPGIYPVLSADYQKYTLTTDVTEATTAITLRLLIGKEQATYYFDAMKGKILSTVTWNGATNNSWNTASNWTPNKVPDANSKVIIPSGLTNYPTIAYDTEINSISIASDATVLTQKTITTSDEKVTFTRNLATNNWYLISSPLSNETFEDFISNNNFATGQTDITNIGISFYDNTKIIGTERWDHQKSDLSGTIENGLGMSVKMATANQELIFNGDINSTNISKTITNGAGTNYNLVGNPFTAYLNSSSFLEANTNALDSKTIWLWNQETEDYITKVALQDFKIAPGQGFFVKGNTNTASNTLIFDVNEQNHQNESTFLKQQQIRLKLKVDNGAIQKEALFYFLDDATLHFDNGYDGELFSDSNNDLQIYSQLLEGDSDKKYQIQSLPTNILNNSVIPIGVDAVSGSQVTFNADLSNFQEGIYVYLEDKNTNTFDELGNTKTYQVDFSANTNGFGRFYLHLSSTVLGLENNNSNSNIYFINNNDKLVIKGVTNNNFELMLYDTLGKEIVRKTFKNENELDLKNYAKGVYIVKIHTDNSQKTQKIIIE